MKRIFYSLIVVITLLAFGCQKDPYPYISKEDTKKIDSAIHPAIKNAAFIYQNNVYYVPDFDKPVIQITSDGSAVKLIKMSHDHSKFAYMDILNNIIVVDNKGNNIATLSQYKQAKCFDWSPDDKTLYILNGNTMAYFGPDMNLPAFTHPGLPTVFGMEVLCAAVSTQGDFAYIYHANLIDGDKYELFIVPANGGQIVSYSDSDVSYDAMIYVNFTANTTDFVVGYGYPNGQLTNVSFFQDLHNYPTVTHGGTATATPVYNSTLNYMVGGATNKTTNAIAPAAIYLGDPPEIVGENVPTSKILTQYSSSGGNMYTDWK